jgi:hypothetical protein
MARVEDLRPQLAWSRRQLSAGNKTDKLVVKFSDLREPRPAGYAARTSSRTHGTI